MDDWLTRAETPRHHPEPMPIYIHKTAAAFHVFEDWQGHTIKRKVGQFATWEQP
jgi:hypothetical protein